MMRACRSVGSVLSLVLPVGIAAAVTGCGEAPAPTPPVVVKHTPTPTYSESSTMQSLPGMKVGTVAGVNTEGGLTTAALVIPEMADVVAGDVFTFTDRGQNVVAVGRVASMTTSPDGAHTFAKIGEIRPTPGGRMPIVGDIAVRQPK